MEGRGSAWDGVGAVPLQRERIKENAEKECVCSPVRDCRGGCSKLSPIFYLLSAAVWVLWAFRHMWLYPSIYADPSFCFLPYQMN